MRVGRRLSESATRVVIIICFMLLILLPLLGSDFWLNSETGTEGAAYTYNAMLNYNFTDKANLSTVLYRSENALNDDANQTRMLAFTTRRLLEDFKGNSKDELLKVIFPNSAVDYYTINKFSDHRLEEIGVGVLTVGALRCKFSKTLRRTA